MSENFKYQCSEAARCYFQKRFSNQSGPSKHKKLPFDLSQEVKRRPKASNMLDESRVQSFSSIFKEAKTYNNPFEDHYL